MLSTAKVTSHFFARFIQGASLQLSSPRLFYYNVTRVTIIHTTIYQHHFRLENLPLQYHLSRSFSIWMVVSHYIGNDEFFKRILIAILFKNFYDPENIKPSTGRKQERVRVVPVPELVPVKQKILHLRLRQKSRYFNRFSIIFAKCLAKSETFVLRPKYFLLYFYQ